MLGWWRWLGVAHEPFRHVGRRLPVAPGMFLPGLQIAPIVLFAAEADDGGVRHGNETTARRLFWLRCLDMSRSLVRRRRTGLSNPNIGSNDVGTAVGYLGLGALIGAGLGALTYTPRTQGALGGAATGVAVTGVGGLVVGIVSDKNRGAGIAAAGIGLGGLALLGLVGSLVRGTVAA